MPGTSSRERDRAEGRLEGGTEDGKRTLPHSCACTSWGKRKPEQSLLYFEGLDVLRSLRPVSYPFWAQNIFIHMKPKVPALPPHSWGSLGLQRQENFANCLDLSKAKTWAAKKATCSVPCSTLLTFLFHLLLYMLYSGPGMSSFLCAFDKLLSFKALLENHLFYWVLLFLCSPALHTCFYCRTYPHCIIITGLHIFPQQDEEFYICIHCL